MGVYRLLGGTDETGPRRLRYDYAVEFGREGALYACNVVVAGGTVPESDERHTQDASVHWVVRVGDRTCNSDAVRPDDFAEGSDFIERMVVAMKAHSVRVRTARPAK
jgi:hypothetical protein